MFDAFAHEDHASLQIEVGTLIHACCLSWRANSTNMFASLDLEQSVMTFCASNEIPGIIQIADVIASQSTRSFGYAPGVCTHEPTNFPWDWVRFWHLSDRHPKFCSIDAGYKLALVNAAWLWGQPEVKMPIILTAKDNRMTYAKSDVSMWKLDSATSVSCDVQILEDHPQEQDGIFQTRLSLLVMRLTYPIYSYLSILCWWLERIIKYLQH